MPRPSPPGRPSGRAGSSAAAGRRPPFRGGPCRVAPDHGGRRLTAGDSAEAAPDAALPPLGFVALRDRLGLTPFELNILLLCAAMELDTSIAGLCARGAARAGARLSHLRAWRSRCSTSPPGKRLSPEGPLRHRHLVEISQPGGAPLTTSRLCADEWVASTI